MFESLSASYDAQTVKIADLGNVFDVKPADVIAYGDRVHYTDKGREILTGLIIESTGDQPVAQGRSRVEEIRLNAFSLEADTGSK
jgi:hypothetical protein